MNFKRLSSLLAVIVLVFAGEGENEFSYFGGWPINPDKEGIEDLGIAGPCPGSIGCECTTPADCDNGNCLAHPKGNYCLPKAGTPMPRFEGIDQFGDSVDLYDFAGQRKIIILELGATWCSPCKDLGAWFSKGDLKIRDNPWWRDKYLPIRDMVENGEVYFISVIYEGEDRGTNATPEMVRKWYEKYPDKNIPILADEYRLLHSWVKPTGLPAIFLIDENMKLINYSSRGLSDAFVYLSKLNN